MKKIVLSLFICLAFTTSVFAEDEDYSYQNRMPFYGNYHQYGGKVIQMFEGPPSPDNKHPVGIYSNIPLSPYGNMYGSMPPMYGNKPPKMYGNKPPKGIYGNHPPMYGSMPPMYGNKPPRMYGNKPPRSMYGNRPPMYGQMPPRH
ncbi:hypothetical protein IKE67_05955 [bacterium]|nr:hypothetical protein [bacterium]